ncbi:hypothetical protein [Aliivibrio salmonicida]|uniref:hypothetical protein n=1 Tax=Aliivibrio salmonicida TaxID=40269 RepID=UPI003D12F56B
MLSKKEHQSLIVCRFIDAYVELHGEINTNVITTQFQLHRATASRILAQYQKKKPSNLHYNLSKKRYVKGYTFEKVFLINESSFLYLNAIELVYSDRMGAS